jgi:hypothetical protein
MPKALIVLLAGLLAGGCIKYEYEHEFWLKVNGSGRVHVTGQPWLWNAFKGIGRTADPEGSISREDIQALFERSGLDVQRVTLTHREGRPYLFIAAEFDDVSKLAGTPAFPDLDLRVVPDGERLRLEGTWRRPAGLETARREAAGLMAVRFHLPSKVYDHKNAAEGVERGNILAWRQELSSALAGQPLDVGATMDKRSILWSTIGLFALAIGGALLTMAAALYWMFRRGLKRQDVEPSPKR